MYEPPAGCVENAKFRRNMRLFPAFNGVSDFGTAAAIELSTRSHGLKAGRKFKNEKANWSVRGWFPGSRVAARLRGVGEQRRGGEPCQERRRGDGLLHQQWRAAD